MSKNLFINIKYMGNFVIVRNPFGIETEVPEDMAKKMIKQWDNLIIVKKDEVDEVDESFDLSKMDINKLREEYLEVFWEEVPNNKKNSEEWIKNKLLSTIK